MKISFQRKEIFMISSGAQLSKISGLQLSKISAPALRSEILKFEFQISNLNFEFQLQLQLRSEILKFEF